MPYLKHADHFVWIKVTLHSLKSEGTTMSMETIPKSFIVGNDLKKIKKKKKKVSQQQGLQNAGQRFTRKNSFCLFISLSVSSVFIFVCFFLLSYSRYICFFLCSYYLSLSSVFLSICFGLPL